jgi:hypothetical protein
MQGHKETTGAEGVQCKELIKVMAWEDSHPPAGVAKTSNDGSLVFEFIDDKVDEASWAVNVSVRHVLCTVT